jgi:hypothetical protein
MNWRSRFVHCVPVFISTVAVNPFEYIEEFLFTALLSVAPYCVRGGIRLVSSSSHAHQNAAPPHVASVSDTLTAELSLSHLTTGGLYNIAVCSLTWGPSSPRKRPLPKLLPSNPQPLSVHPGVAVRAPPPTTQDRPRYLYSRECQLPFFSEKYLESQLFSDTRKGWNIRVRLFHRPSATQVARTFGPCPLASLWGVTVMG